MQSVGTGDLPESSGPVTIGGAAVLGLAASAATILFSIARAKTTAVVLGPEGIGITAEILQIVTLAQAPAAVFSGAALVSRLSATRAAGDERAMGVAYSGAWILSAGVAALTGAGAVIAGLFLLPGPWNRTGWPLTALAAAGGTLAVVAAIPGQVLTAFGRLRTLTLITTGAAFVQTAFVVAGTLAFGLRGQFVAMAAGPVPALGLALWLGARAEPSFRWRPRAVFDSGFAREAFAYGATSFVAILGLQAALFAARFSLEAHGGPALNGQFQVAWALGSVYFGFILTSIGTYSFPRFAATQSAPQLESEVLHATRFVLRVAPPVVLAMIALRAPLVRLLYSNSFEEAVPVMGLMMAGDLARGLVWVQQGPLLYRGKLRAYLAIEVLGVLGLGLGAVVLVPWFGLDGFGYAYTGTYLLLVPLSALALRWSTGARASGRSSLWALITAALSLSAAQLGSATPLRRAGVLLVALAWAWASGLLRTMLEGVAARWPKRSERNGPAERESRPVP